MNLGPDSSDADLDKLRGVIESLTMNVANELTPLHLSYWVFAKFTLDIIGSVTISLLLLVGGVELNLGPDSSDAELDILRGPIESLTMTVKRTTPERELHQTK